MSENPPLEDGKSAELQDGETPKEPDAAPPAPKRKRSAVPSWMASVALGVGLVAGMLLGTSLDMQKALEKADSAATAMSSPSAKPFALVDDGATLPDGYLPPELPGRYVSGYQAEVYIQESLTAADKTVGDYLRASGLTFQAPVAVSIPATSKGSWHSKCAGRPITTNYPSVVYCRSDFDGRGAIYLSHYTLEKGYAWQQVAPSGQKDWVGSPFNAAAVGVHAYANFLTDQVRLQGRNFSWLDSELFPLCLTGVWASVAHPQLDGSYLPDALRAIDDLNGWPPRRTTDERLAALRLGAGSHRPQLCFERYWSSKATATPSRSVAPNGGFTASPLPSLTS